MKRLLVALLLVALSAGLAGQAVAAAPPPGKGPPEFDKIVFVHYPKGELPGKPSGTPGKGGESPYKYERYHWADTSLPVPYLVNLGGRGASFLAGIQAGFQTWENDPESDMDFEYGGTTTTGISSLSNGMDGLNVVGWADISSSNPGAIAVTIYWYNRATKLVVEVDMALNTKGYTWWQNGTGDELWDIGNTSSAYDVDVQNIITHEAGHWLVLGDLYNANNSEQTMYGTSAEFELKKRSLNSGDIAGIRKIY